MGDAPRTLDAEALELFARKGREGGPNVPQAGPANAVKVRRILTLTRDLARKPWTGMRILDLGCGEGVYAIEAAAHGATVVAIDARTERMQQGVACAARHGLSSVSFRQEDVRQVSSESHGSFDVVWCLGLLYHLDTPAVFDVLRRLREVCAGALVIDTLVSTTPDTEAIDGRHRYEGARVREHDDEDPPAARRAKVLKSIDNTFSFRFTKPSLVRALTDAGFASVLEVHGPLEPGKAADRVTLVAYPGSPAPLSTYPWVNGLGEAQIRERLQVSGGTAVAREAPLDRWIDALYQHPELTTMGHNQRHADRNLGLGWLYYGLARIVRPRRAVVIGSWRGFVPLLIARGFQDNQEDSEVTFIDPSLVDDFWTDPARVDAWFSGFGLSNVRHVRATTQEYAARRGTGSSGPDATDEIGLLFIDGYHSAEQARFDWETFHGRLGPRGIALFHDSMNRIRSGIYGAAKSYEIDVHAYLATLKRDPGLQVFDLPYGTGLTLVRKATDAALEPFLEGLVGRP